MIAGGSEYYYRQCSCGATGCPEVCIGFYDSNKDWDYYTYHTQEEEKPSTKENMNWRYDGQRFRTVFKKVNRFCRKECFSKSGYLPRRIRESRKNK